jgi:3-methylfumaryl-CoA hydratase
MMAEAATAEGPDAWLGRTETQTGRLTREGAAMLAATLDHPAARLAAPGDGAPMPPLWHWAAFNAYPPMDALGRDGHPQRGGFLPPVPLERRMWAGGELGFTGTLRVGETLRRRSEITAVSRKEGSSGPMVFVTVTRRIEGEAGGRVDERQDIVYLSIPGRFRPPRALPAPAAPLFSEEVPMTGARLFRFSAATFNAHRIHYDLAYTREVEKYPDLVVHGPMQAALLMEAAARHGGARPRRFRFRGVHPLFLGDGLRLVATPGESAGTLALATVAGAGHQCLQARFEGAGA